MASAFETLIDRLYHFPTFLDKSKFGEVRNHTVSADTLNTAELYRLATESDFHIFSPYQLLWNRP